MKPSVILFICVSLMVSGCGDLLNVEREKKVHKLLPCSPNPSALKRILTENIQPELSCLGESLHVFVKMVENGSRPGYLSFPTLKTFVEDNISTVDPIIFQPLSGFFEINALLSGDEPLHIKKDNIDDLMKTLAKINEAMVSYNIKSYFSEDKPISYEEHTKRKAAVFKAFTKAKEALVGLYKDNANEVVLLGLLDKFKEVGNTKVLKAGEKLLFVKKVFLGGDKRVLSARELKSLIAMLPEVAKVAFDMVSLPQVETGEYDGQEMMESLAEDFETLGAKLPWTRYSEETVLRLGEGLELARDLFPELEDLLKFEHSALKLKEVLLGSEGDAITGRDLVTLVNDIILSNLKRGVYFYKAYAAKKDDLDFPTPLFRKLKGLVAGSGEELRFRNDFERIAKDYRFFIDANWVASYQNDILRSPWGMFVVATMEDLAIRVFSKYGYADPKAYGGYRLSRKEIKTILEDFREILNGKKLILKGREVNAAETIELMSSLFQGQSDGKGKDIEINEIVEFVTTMVTGFRFSASVYEELASFCPLNEKGKVYPSCLRENFRGVFDLTPGDSVKTYGEYFPKLASYVRAMDKESSDAFVDKMSIFTRPCNRFEDGEPVPVSKGDLFMFLTGLLNIESTYSRFDVGGGEKGEPNNILEVRELKKAFGRVYKDAIRAKVPGPLKWRAEDVFFFLLDRGEEPGALEMLGRITIFGYPEKAADRDAVASVLKVIAQGSEANKTNPYNCELLR